MFFQFSKIVLLFALALVFALPNFSVLAKESSDNLEEICESMERVEEICDKLNPEECRQVLEECEQFLEEKSIQIGKEITKTAKEKKTLSNKINLLKKTIEELSYKIYQNSLSIKDLGLQISDTQNSVSRTSLKIENSKSQLKKILRGIYEKEECSYLEIILIRDSFSVFFDEIFYLETLSIKLQRILENIKELKNYLQGQGKVMTEEREDLENLVKIQNIQKRESKETKEEKARFLEMTEAEYQKYLKEKEETEKKVAEIRHRLFELIGVSEGGIEFGKAVEIAQYVEKVTGTRAAFLLSIIAQESMKYNKFGENVGGCYLKNKETGDGIYIKSGNKAPRTMKPTRDVTPFLNIIKELNEAENLARDPFRTPVSCCMYYKGSPTGWGGAMGPAQFIPSTWVLYKDKVSKIIGKLADPWKTKDSFIASGSYLADLGAFKQTYNTEWNAAMRYFSGTATRKKSNQYGFYGDKVMSRAKTYQKEIDLLEKK